MNDFGWIKLCRVDDVALDRGVAALPADDPASPVAVFRLSPVSHEASPDADHTDGREEWFAVSHLDGDADHDLQRSV